eukprot:TRINITY_DN4465_c0_g1_i3.p1 TRINITY_DN4465_c0_g1~~TRINITY_DN4465_c0_g1_i3.p1  ORF type:complete len:441 (-),score=76.32 TRINITY_DN4465_c0_g1_i3:132-1454(-)
MENSAEPQRPSHPTPATMSILDNPYFIFVFIAMCAFCAGTLYSFGEYASKLAALLGHQNLDIIGSWGDFGVFTGIIQGVILDRYGPRVTLLLAALLTSSGYFFASLMINGVISSNLTLLAFGYFCLGQGCHGVSVTCVSVNAQNFPLKSRGLAVGITYSIMVFSVLFFVPMYAHVLDRDLHKFFLMLVILLPSVFCLGACFIKVVPRTDAEVEEESLLEPQESVAVHPREVLKTVEFWYLWVIFFCVVGPGVMWKNIVGSVTRDLDATQYKETLVIGFAVFNGISRLSAGAVSDYFQHTISRPLWFMLGAMAECVGHLLFVALGVIGIIPCDILTAIGYGLTFCMISTVLGILFGMKYYGTVYGFLAFAPALGGLMFTEISTKISASQRESFGHCSGMHCFRYQFILTSFVLLIAALVAYRLSNTPRSRHVFSHDKNLPH